jgi:hypothetical protein
MDIRWVQIRSWHAVDTPTRMFDTYKTVCGRRVATTDVRDNLPAGKSCETCLRTVGRRADGSEG